MPITLLPPLTRGGPFVGGIRQEALVHGPGFARSSGGSRWHRVRSAVQHRVGDAAAHISYHAWCGQSLYSTHCRAVDEPDDGAPVCGTCEGRALGHDPKRPELLFTPETLAPPRFCPSRTLFVDAGSNVGRCLACGELAPVKVHGWNGYPKLQRHVALDLVEGCPFHAWRYLVQAGETAVCSCSLESERGAA
jgi:hypothetical protein